MLIVNFSDQTNEFQKVFTAKKVLLPLVKAVTNESKKMSSNIFKDILFAKVAAKWLPKCSEIQAIYMYARSYS